MSFKAKTILLLTVLGLTPYVVTMMLLLDVFRADLEDRLLKDMETQLQGTLDQIDRQLLRLENDLNFMASLDTMNDVLSGDLDGRINGLLDLKKNDLNLIGDFLVVDTNNLVISSTDPGRIQAPYSGDRFYSVPIHSNFIDGAIGSLIVEYSDENLQRNLVSSDQFRYQLISSDTIVKPSRQNDVLSVTGEVVRWPGIRLALIKPRDLAFASLDRLTLLFYVALLVGMLVIAALAFLLANYILRPILELSSTAGAITETQDFSRRVAVNSSDEIGQLSQVFNRMLEGIQDMLRRLSEENENRIQLAQEKNRAEMLQTLSTKLSKYLSPQIYESIFAGETDVTLGSSRKKLTVFFSDIVGFTTTSDEMESEDLTSLLNQYLREMTDIALAHGATIDKYIGDAIMIFFGDPHSEGIEEDARKCVAMAIDMQKRVRELQGEWRSVGFVRPFEIRVGIHTGYCTVGNFGTDSRMDYTIIGSAVNLASRIESSAEPGQIYVSEDTQLMVNTAFHCDLATTIIPKGFSKEVKLYRVAMNELPEAPYEMDARGIRFNIDPKHLDAATIAKLEALLKPKR